MEVLDGGVQEGHQRHGEDRADQAHDRGAPGHGQEYGQRVQADRTPHDQRLQDVAFDLLDQEHHAEHDQGVHPAVGHERQQHGHRAGQEGTHEGDERAEEHQHTEGQSQRHAEDQGAQSDAQGIDERHEDLDPDVAAEGSPADISGAVDGIAMAGGDEVQAEPPDPLPVIEEEDQREDGQHRAGGDVAGGGAEAQSTREDGLAVGPDRLAEVREDVVPLVRGDAEGLQPDDDALDPHHDLVPHVRESHGELLADEGEQAQDEDDESEDDAGHGQAARDAPSHEPLVDRREEGGQQGRHDQGDDQEGDMAQQPDACPGHRQHQ